MKQNPCSSVRDENAGISANALGITVKLFVNLDKFRHHSIRNSEKSLEVF